MKIITGRKDKRNRVRVNKVHNDMVNKFLSELDYNAERHEFTTATRERAEAMKEKWARFCHGKPYSEDVRRSISNTIKVVEVYLMLESKYEAYIHKSMPLFFIRQNPTWDANTICAKIVADNLHTLHQPTEKS